MKKIVFGIMILVMMMQACQKKSLPTITTRSKEPSAPVIPVADIKPDMEVGKTIFTNRCGRCHALPDPAKYTTTRWEGILLSMMPKARLSREQEVHIKAYINANSGK